MKPLKYKAIRSKEQYNVYCKVLKELVNEDSRSKAANDEIELLTILAGKWGQEHTTFQEANLIELLQSHG